MLTVQHPTQPVVIDSPATTELPDDFGKCYRLGIRQVVKVHGNSVPQLPSVIVGYPDAQTAKLAHSQEGYRRRKAQGREDYAKALAPIAKSFGESVLHKVGSALKRLQDRSVKQISLICRYVGLAFMTNAIKSRLNPKVDIVHAKFNAFRRADMLNELKGVQSASGVRMPIQPPITKSSPCAGRTDYDYDAAQVMSEQDARERSDAVVARKEQMLNAIRRVDSARAARDHELRVHYVNNLKAEEIRNAQNNRAVSAPNCQISSKGGFAFYHQPEPVTPKMQRAKAAMDEKMIRRADRQRFRDDHNRQANARRHIQTKARKQITADIAKAAKVLARKE